MSPASAAEVIETDGCSIVLRRVTGPEAAELFFSCRPNAGTGAREQASAAWRAILAVLKADDGNFACVVSETVFLRDSRTDLNPVREARARVLAACEGPRHRPATTEIEQPPLDGDAHLAVLIHAVVPKGPPPQVDSFEPATSCRCAECARSHGLRITNGAEARLYAGGLYGPGRDAYQQTLAMFDVADNLLERADLTFHDVMRTWIYLPEMERDYADFNRARREFFAARGIDPVPASTGIGAGLVAADHQVGLGICAVKSSPPTRRTVMTTPTLNEAPEYGSDFSRGMRVEEGNKVSLLVSGTASLDETGETVFRDDFEGQARRMLLNVERLLREQGAGFTDVVSAITYLKRPGDLRALQEIFRSTGYEGFPNVLVEAPVCRSELLCETELMAVLPRGRQSADPDTS